MGVKDLLSCIEDFHWPAALLRENSGAKFKVKWLGLAAKGAAQCGLNNPYVALWDP